MRILPAFIVGELHIEDDAGVVLAALLLFLITLGLRQGASSRALKRLLSRTIHLRDVLTDLYDDGQDVIRLAILIFAQDQDTIPSSIPEAILLTRDPTRRLASELKALASSHKRVLNARTPKNHR